MPTARLLVDEPAPGAWNMAVDEALLRTAAETRQTTLRFYAWNEPTVSLGYFQETNERDSHGPSRGCPLVRRSTGGGAIVHDRELTYSFTSPIGDRLSRDVQRLVFDFHETLADVLTDFGVPAELYRDSGTPSPAHGRPHFLCFRRHTDGDVVLNGGKVTGSAQRRFKNAVLQHGTVLLFISAHAPELPGIADLAGQSIQVDELQQQWAAKLSQRLDLQFANEPLSQTESNLARELSAGKYDSSAWNHRR